MYIPTQSIEVPHHLITCSQCGAKEAEPGHQPRVLRLDPHVCKLCHILPRMPSEARDVWIFGLRFWKLRLGGDHAQSFIQRAIGSKLIEPACRVVAAPAREVATPGGYVYEHRDYNQPWRVTIATRGDNRRLGPALPRHGWVLWITLNGLAPYKSDDHCQRLLRQAGVRPSHIPFGSRQEPQRWVQHVVRHLDHHPLFRPEQAVRDVVRRLLQRQADLGCAGSVDWSLAKHFDVD